MEQNIQDRTRLSQLYIQYVRCNIAKNRHLDTFDFYFRCVFLQYRLHVMSCLNDCSDYQALSANITESLQSLGYILCHLLEVAHRGNDLPATALQ